MRTFGRRDSISRNAAAPQRPARAAHPLLHLQRTAGNQAVLQRFVFIKKQLLDAKDPRLQEVKPTDEMTRMIGDDDVREYKGIDEFKDHADKKTDYLGNLNDGTWVRFSPTGINILGERHNAVTLEDVVPAVGAKSFIYERLASDVLTDRPHLEQAYETENKKKLGEIRTGFEVKQDQTRQFGAESLYPKMAYALLDARPFLTGKQPLSAMGYGGNPYQRYLKLAWSLSKDNQHEVKRALESKEPIPPRLQALAEVHQTLEKENDQLDRFITSLPVDGHLGQALALEPNRQFRRVLLRFIEPFVAAIADLAPAEQNPSLSAAEREALADTKATADEKSAVLGKWRNQTFLQNVRAATERRVRYAGMGRNHLNFLIAFGLQDEQWAFDMVDDPKLREGKHARPVREELLVVNDLRGFKRRTESLKSKARETPETKR